MQNRLQLEITGIVQGVGFRPFVYRIAKNLALTGFVCNNVTGVQIEIQGEQQQLDLFLIKLKTELPAVAKIETCNVSTISITATTEESDFIIKFSNTAAEKTARISPDLATCPDCLQEIFDTSNKRHLYPFTNCTNCGPRFSIVKALPYDRCNTSMHEFIMCKQCNEEYHDVTNRRFHAQPNACWECGPKIELLDINKDKQIIAKQLDALSQAIAALQQGKIIAVKGLGGFHLLVDARNHDAVARLRNQKHRQDKPLAIMVPNLQYIQNICEINIYEETLLTSQQAPIVLLKTREHTSILARNIAPNNPYLGVMLPYTPLHHILLKQLDFPVVATSGNFSGEPICKDTDEAVLKLGSIADLFLVHNREIVNRIDDSVVRPINQEKIFLRRARGYSPYYCIIPDFFKPILAVGANMKNTFALAQAGNVLLSQHIGDLENLAALSFFKSSINNIQTIYNCFPEVIACDLHQDYLSTKYANDNSEQVIAVQHHHAHIVAVMVEKQIEGPVLGVVWDGSGFGLDDTVWGGEFLVATKCDFNRVGHLGLLPLPGSEKAIKEPYRIAIGMLTKLSKDVLHDYSDLNLVKKFKNSDLRLLLNMVSREINTPMTSSVGRLFDAVAALLGLRYKVNFEGQAAMELEFLAENVATNATYKFEIIADGVNTIIDWRIMLQQILQDLRQHEQPGIMAKKFHNTLVDIIVFMAKRNGIKEVVLAGGCFQNKILLEHTIEELESNGFVVYWPVDVPINDGGIALGQIAIINARL